jgi:leader peptidase (prepilin peptidase)/N-methyltransferase
MPSSEIAWAAIIASPVIGSFLGVVVERLPSGRQFLWGRSECDACGHVLGAADLIPFASWFLSRGRCRYCGARLSAFYPLIELAAVMIAISAAAATSGVTFIASCILGWALLVAGAMGWRRFKSIFAPAIALLIWALWLWAPAILSK